MQLKASLLALFLVVVTGCNTVTIRAEGTRRLASEPTYESTEHFFFWGLAGESHIDVTEVCGDGRMVQMHSQHTFLDGLLSFLTIGIYQPSHARVWCE